MEINIAKILRPAKIAALRIFYKVIGNRGNFLIHRLKHRPSVRHVRHGFVALHVPKAAGTSVNDALGVCDVGHLSVEELTRYYPEYFNIRMKFLVVVRDPLSRLLSTYAYAVESARKKGYSSLGWAEAHEDVGSFIEHVLDAELYKNHYFFRPTQEFIRGVSGEIWLLDFDRLEEGLLSFGRMVNLPIRLRRLNVTQDQNTTNSLISELRTRVSECYAEDYLLLREAKKASNGLVRIS